jgi:hypothetical protein
MVGRILHPATVLRLGSKLSLIVAVMASLNGCGSERRMYDQSLACIVNEMAMHMEIEQQTDPRKPMIGQSFAQALMDKAIKEGQSIGISERQVRAAVRTQVTAEIERDVAEGNRAFDKRTRKSKVCGGLFQPDHLKTTLT